MAVIFAEQTLNFAYDSNYGVYVNNSNPSVFLPIAGKTYRVVWDGTEYVVTAISHESFPGQVLMGNQMLAGGENTGQPFAMASLEDGSGMTIFALDAKDTHVIAVYLVEDEVPDEPELPTGIVLKDHAGNDIIYEGVKSIRVQTSDGGSKSFVAGEAVAVTVDLAMADGDMIIEPDEGKLFSSVTVKKPFTLSSENIAKGVDIGGVVGTFVGNSTDIGEVGDDECVITVIDYDGSIIKKSKVKHGSVYILPDAPEHDRLVFDGWSSPVEITNNTIAVDNFDFTIGIIYHTASGATELDIELTPETGLSLSFRGNAYISGYTSIDWGDGTANTSLSHTYESYGNYTIKIYGATVLSGGSSSYNIFGSATANQRYCVRKAFIANTVTNIAIGAFKGFYNLQCVTIPNSVTSIGDYAFGSIYTETTIIIPNSVTKLGIAFNYCVGLNTIILPYSITALKGSTFYQASLVKNDLVIPKGITVLNAGAFTNCTAVKKVIVLGDITSISGNAFQNFYSCEEYDFTRCTRVPSFNNTPIGKCGIQKIKVPASLYDAWVASWSTYANYIVAV